MLCLSFCLLSVYLCVSHAASAYWLSALNGPHSHTHFCFFLAFFSESGGEAKWHEKEKEEKGVRENSLHPFVLLFVFK